MNGKLQMDFVISLCPGVELVGHVEDKRIGTGNLPVFWQIFNSFIWTRQLWALPKRSLEWIAELSEEQNTSTLTLTGTAEILNDQSRKLQRIEYFRIDAFKTCWTVICTTSKCCWKWECNSNSSMFSSTHLKHKNLTRRTFWQYCLHNIKGHCISVV